MIKHLGDYLALLSIFGLALFFFFFFSYNQTAQIMVVVSLSLAYFLWGLSHHYHEENLHFKVVIEYFLIALLGAILVISLLYRA